MSYSLDLSGRVALITGASSGLGAQFARTLAGAGAAVVLASRRVEMLKTLRADIEAEGGDAHVVSLDVTSRKSIDSAIETAEKDVGPIDILVNNSGVSTTQRLVDVREEDFDFVFNTNVLFLWPKPWARACWPDQKAWPRVRSQAGASSISLRWPRFACCRKLASIA
jgi:NAD(P)-dependent dehydrogenase (short-subunit alcohol dehydrogenase family)